MSEKNGSSTAPVAYMWCAHTADRQGGDRERREHHALVAEQRLAGEHRDDLGDDAEERQREDVDLGVAEEPEQVLPEDRAAVGGVEDVRAEVPVGQQARTAPRSGSGRRAGSGTTVTRMFQVKIGIRNIVMPGARRQMIVVMKLTPPRIVPRPPTARPTIHRSPPAPGECTDVRQRRVGGPAEVGGAARGEERRHHDQRAEQEQPVREGVQPRERDVRRADLQRHDEVREPEQRRRREEQQHDRAVHGEQLVVLLVAQELLPGHAPARPASAAPSRRRP